MKMKLLQVISILIILFKVEASFVDYLNSAFSFLHTKEAPRANELIDFQKKVPYELSLTDEKFIAEAIKLTGVGASELDSCQHRVRRQYIQTLYNLHTRFQQVVLQLKTSCQQMNDEQLAKMAVMLLNCQSAVEDRQLYPCTETMSLKDCTSNMDSIAWNTYHIMSNRARAVCYYIRNVQFRGLTEQTVNQLMDSAQRQIKKLHEISDDQKNLQGITKETINTITSGNSFLITQFPNLNRILWQVIKIYLINRMI